MDTYPILDGQELVFAFEVENIYISPKRIGSLLCPIPGVTDVRVRRLFQSPSEIHVSFRYSGRDFIVWEPYADNSRFWIGPKDESSESIDIRPVMAAFESYSPSCFAKVLGGVFSLGAKHGAGPKGRAEDVRP
jgi:hypothetical protein